MERQRTMHTSQQRNFWLEGKKKWLILRVARFWHRCTEMLLHILALPKIQVDKAPSNPVLSLPALRRDCTWCFPEPLPMKPGWLFSGGESLQRAVEKSLGEKSVYTLPKGFLQRTERWHLPHKGSYGSYLDLGYKSAKAILLTSPSELLLRD